MGLSYPPAAQALDAHQEDALDEALAESFPASDPVAVAISTAAPAAPGRDAPAAPS